ncbi:hypothetical protein TNCV_2324121 [Trichonephila clavipes]|nr:hypothetical protein TNCV_2324121 [Trichonephila clavipes]
MVGKEASVCLAERIDGCVLCVVRYYSDDKEHWEYPKGREVSPAAAHPLSTAGLSLCIEYNPEMTYYYVWVGPKVDNLLKYTM